DTATISTVGSSRTARFLGKPLGLVGAVGVSLIVLLSLFAPLLSAHGPAAIDYDAFLQPPSMNHLLGTDFIGRDVLARLLDGGRVVLTVVVLAIGSALVVGTAIGIVAGYYGGVLDAVLM